MSDERVKATCPNCGDVAFFVIDLHPGADYPVVRIVCQHCEKVWRLEELKGIEWLEVPF